MLLQHYIRTVPKQILGYTLHKKLCVNIGRTFYNNKDVINDLIKNLEKKESIFTQNPKKYFMARCQPTDFQETTRYHIILTPLKNWCKKALNNQQLFLRTQDYKYRMKNGPDLDTAKIVLKYGGRIKVKNYNEWIENTELDKLPPSFDPRFCLVGMEIKDYHSKRSIIQDLNGLYHLTWLSFRGCEFINDWSLDEIAMKLPMLEYLDISECINVTEKGLEALYKIPNLKKLITTNHYKTCAFELTCCMLEDINPHLKCEILDSKRTLLPKQ